VSHQWDHGPYVKHGCRWNVQYLFCWKCGKEVWIGSRDYEDVHVEWIKSLRHKYLVEKFNPWRDDQGNPVWPLQEDSGNTLLEAVFGPVSSPPQSIVAQSSGPVMRSSRSNSGWEKREEVEEVLRNQGYSVEKARCGNSNWYVMIAERNGFRKLVGVVRKNNGYRSKMRKSIASFKDSLPLNLIELWCYSGDLWFIEVIWESRM
jgi:hypothetical protein